jgi:N-acetylneuraminate synthase
MIFVVAELGANWKGNYETLQRMCVRAQQAGCDAVKFQCLSEELIKRHPEWDWYSSASITPGNIDFIHKIVTKYGLEMFVTPTYLECIDWIDPYVDRWKIRHADRNKEDLIRTCLKTNKKVIISTDRPLDPKVFLPYADARVNQIYCIPKYPTEYGELNFDMIKLLRGFSNHCLNPLAVLQAVRHGAKYVEFHLTDDRNEFAIDNKVSFSYAEMDELVRWIRIYESNNRH